MRKSQRRDTTGFVYVHYYYRSFYDQPYIIKVNLNKYEDP